MKRENIKKSTFQVEYCTHRLNIIQLGLDEEVVCSGVVSLCFKLSVICYPLKHEIQTQISKDGGVVKINPVIV